MSITDFPVELLGLVVECVPCGSSLRSLRAVNKTFCVLATPGAFRVAYVTNSLLSVSGFRSLIHSVELANMVETVVFRWKEHEEKTADGEVASGVHAALGAAFSELFRLPALVCLELHCYVGSTYLTEVREGALVPSEGGQYQATISEALLRNPSLPRLRSLTLANLAPDPYLFYFDDFKFTAMLAPLEHLALSFHGILSLGGPFDGEGWCQFWQEFIPSHFLRPLGPHLTSLAITSDMPTISLEFGDLFFPELRQLELGGLVFDQRRIIEDFIVRHGHTLRSLILDSCPMHIQGSDVAPPRPWRVVCERFAEELTALVDVRIYLRTGWGLDNMRRSDELRLTYGAAYDSVRGEHTSAFEIADRPSLERLLEVVMTRRDLTRCAEGRP